MKIKKNLLLYFKNHPFFETLLHFKNYFSSDIASKAIGFISIPIFTRILSVEDYGVISVLFSSLTFFTVIMTLNLHNGIYRFYFEKNQNFKKYIGTTAFLVGSMFLILSLGFVYFRSQIAKLLNLPINTMTYIPLFVFLQIISKFFSQIFKAKKNSKKIAITNVLNTYLGFGLSIIFILILSNNKYLGRIWGTLIIQLFISIYFILQIKPFFKVSFNWKMIKFNLLFCLPLIPHSLSSNILSYFDRIMINRLSSTANAGLYSFAYNIGMLFVVFTGTFFSAWLPDYYKNMNNNNFKTINSEIKFMFRIFILVATFLIYVSKEVGMILAPDKYYGALFVIPIIVFGYVFMVFYQIYNLVFGFSKKTFYYPLVTIIAGVVNILLNSIFIKKYGYSAAAFTSVVSYIIMGLLTWAISKIFLKKYFSPSIVLFIEPLGILVLFVLLYVFIILLNISFIYAILIKFVLLILLIFILFYKDIKRFMKRT